MSNQQKSSCDQLNDPLKYDPARLASKTEFLSNNERGRPTLEKVIKFSPEPKSLAIEQFINQRTEELQENCTIDFEDEPAVISQRSIISTQVNLPETINQQHSCDYPDCSYTCKLSCNLIKHKRTHTAEKPYLCDQCTFRSNFVNSLKVHKRIHTTERPYSCKHCSYKCNSSSNLKKHTLRHTAGNT